MMSAFGMASAMILVASVFMLIFHFKLMKKRSPIDIEFAKIDELLRARLDMLFQQEGTDAFDLLETLHFSETGQLVKNWHNLQIGEDNEAFEQNKNDIAAAINNYNAYVIVYNAYISKYPGSAIAFLTGLRKEKELPPIVEEGELA